MGCEKITSYIYIYPQVFAGWRGGVVHALVCLCEQEKTELSVDLSSCFRVATESCRFEKLIALQNLSLGTVKIGTVYLEQGSFLGFFIHTYTCPLQGVPLLSLHQTTLCKTTTDLFLLYHLVLSSFCSPQTITCLLSDFCHLTLFLINVLSVNEISHQQGREKMKHVKVWLGDCKSPFVWGHSYTFTES